MSSQGLGTSQILQQIEGIRNKLDELEININTLLGGGSDLTEQEREDYNMVYRILTEFCLKRSEPWPKDKATDYIVKNSKWLLRDKINPTLHRKRRGPFLLKVLKDIYENDGKKEGGEIEVSVL